MRLRVPGGQMQHVFSTLWFWFVEVRIRLCERAEQFAMPAFEVQTKGSVEGVAGFVPQDAHAFGVSAAFHLQHLLPFELHQARMGEENGIAMPGTPSGENHSSASQTWGLKRIPRALSSL